MRRMFTGSAVAIVAAVLFATAAIHAGSGGTALSPRTKLTIVAPAAPGGGWDTFARETQQVLRTDGIASAVQVKNIPGASGTIGLGQLSEMGDRHDVVMVTGGVMVGGILVNDSRVTLDDVTLIARLADDFNVLVVPAASPYRTLDDFVAALAEDPGGNAIAGGSLGGIDHLLAGMLGREVGIDPASVNYLAFPGGGEVVSSLLSNSAAAGLSGYNEFRDQIEGGNLRALAISSPEPLDDVDVPTFVEQGIDVSMANWRGYVAPPGISDDVKSELVDMVTELHDSASWQEMLARNRWEDSFMVGEELDEFVASEIARSEEIVEELGL